MTKPTKTESVLLAPLSVTPLGSAKLAEPSFGVCPSGAELTCYQTPLSWPGPCPYAPIAHSESKISTRR